MLKVQNLTFDVLEEGGKKNILGNVSFQVKKGELLIITGPNGSGKSTLAKVLMGIEKATSGHIFLEGEDITDFSIDSRAKAGIGYAFQQPARFKGMTVERLLSLAAGRKLPEKECCDLLSGVGLCAREYLNRQADATLSGGEMKRIEIATVLAGKHKICIFDEPEAGIDLWSFSMLVKRFEEIRQDKEQSIIIISHQERLIEMADRILLLKDGGIDCIGTKDEVMPRLSGVRQTKGCLERHQIHQ
ncbi:MAG: ATP-binding cassette domain-containing protein [Lachnospiraceae bacterium]|nr:ATP-binding cassette domain-containing protein [Lachnospiraceae bacterium]MBQ9123156.1 ATP-binding cassette domain-containing protein [Lachnospiraceae bacterium]